MTPSFSRMTLRLLQAGLPAAYVARTVSELRDHCHEAECHAAVEDANCRDANPNNLGDLHSLTEQFVMEYRRSHWLGRNPMVGYLLAPPCLLIACWLTYFLMATLLLILFNPHMSDDESLGPTWGTLHPWTVWWMQFIYYASKVVPFAVTMGILARAACRSGRPLSWLFLPTILVALCGQQLLFSQLVLPDNSTISGGYFSIWIGSPAEAALGRSSSPQLQQLQWAVPIIVALAVASRAWFTNRLIRQQYARSLYPN